MRKLFGATEHGEIAADKDVLAPISVGKNLGKWRGRIG